MPCAIAASSAPSTPPKMPCEPVILGDPFGRYEPPAKEHLAEPLPRLRLFVERQSHRRFVERARLDEELAEARPRRRHVEHEAPISECPRAPQSARFAELRIDARAE